MDGEQILSIIIMTFCSLFCAAIFYGIGVWAGKRKDPMHFYSGTTVDPRTISDVPAYNRANAKMWKLFSLPFWLCALFSILRIWDDRFSMVSVGLLVAGCTVGVGWLLNKYHRILKEFTVR